MAFLESAQIFAALDISKLTFNTLIFDDQFTFGHWMPEKFGTGVSDAKIFENRDLTHQIFMLGHYRDIFDGYSEILA